VPEAAPAIATPEPEPVASASASSSASAPADDDAPQKEGFIDPKKIQEAMRTAFVDFNGCYQQSLSRGRARETTAHVALVINDKGRVRNALVMGLRDETLAECLKKRIKTLLFPPPDGGGEVQVGYPLVFEAAAKPKQAPVAVQKRGAHEPSYSSVLEEDAPINSPAYQSNEAPQKKSVKPPAESEPPQQQESGNGDMGAAF
jgi:hypothetical protein